MNGRFTPAEDGFAAERAWFHRLVNAREDPAALAGARDWLDGLLAAADGELAPPSCSGGAQVRPGAALDWEADTLAFHAPLGLLEGAWLQAVALAANHQRPEAAALFAAGLALLGRDEAASPAFAYRGLSQRHGLALPPVSAWRFAQSAAVGGPALRFACVQLALGLHAARFAPEALGFTQAWLASAAPWKLAALATPDCNRVLAAVAGAAEQAGQAMPGAAARVRRGYALWQQGVADYQAGWAVWAAQDRGLAGQVAALFRRKRRFALGYHPRVMLGGRALAQWLSAEPFDAAGFLAAFAASPYAAGIPGQRPFQRLAGFGGPMFGVFTAEELALLEAWLDAGAPLPAAPAQVTQSFCEPPPLPPPAGPAPRRPGGVLALAPDTRSLFHRLVNQDLRSETQDAAQRWAGRILARARWLPSRLPLKRFFPYAPDAFARRIEQIHAAEVAKRRPFSPPPKLRREEYVWGIRQFAPAILVDGAWLQFQGEAAAQDSRWQRLLQRIYAEELGEGRLAWNHPQIYRELLDGLGIALPPVDDLAFARDPGFLDAAFDLPAYLLAIARFPKTLLPEALGLNLAIELSGLGAGYLRLADELRHHGIDPLIVRLHLSIDNLAGGHAAMAAEAVELYLDEVGGLDGAAAQQAAWRRVWTGYRSLEAATARFRRALLVGLVRRFLPGRLIRGAFPA